MARITSNDIKPVCDTTLGLAILGVVLAAVCVLVPMLLPTPPSLHTIFVVLAYGGLCLLLGSIGLIFLVWVPLYDLYMANLLAFSVGLLRRIPEWTMAFSSATVRRFTRPPRHCHH